MTDLLSHRGPDGQGNWSEHGVLLAHRRLAVIDTSSAADQPMHDETGTIHVVFNGAIYNFRALRGELIAAGYRFRSQGDTEIIVHGYRAWGTGLFARLTGMFAIVIWDERTNTLVAARDRFGEKPLYYAERPDALLFASEIKAILTWPGMRRQPNFDALHDFLSFSYVVGESTAFVGVHRVPPAHIMVCQRGKPPRMEAYWHLPVAGSSPVSGSVEDLKVELIERLRAAVQMCLVADVPVGAFLSGGVDSSAIVSLTAPVHEAGLETFSSGFGVAGYDERHFAEMVAARYRTNHHAFTFGDGILDTAALLAWHYDEPFADSSALVAYALSQETRRRVTVALTGDGADETFLGYGRYLRYGAMRRRVPPGGGRRLPALYEIGESGLKAARPAGDAYGYLVETFRENHKLVGYDLALLPHLDRCTYDRLAAHVVAGVSPEEEAGRIDLATYLPGDLLVKVDIAAMAHGLETRAPFLNHELVEWVSRIPVKHKVWGAEGKALLKAALEPFVPAECLYRPKVGFRVPVARLLREQAYEAARSTLLGERFLDRRLIRRSFIEEMLQEHRTQQQEHGTRLWALLMLEFWFRTWIDRDDNRPLDDNENPFAEPTCDVPLGLLLHEEVAPTPTAASTNFSPSTGNIPTD